MSTENHLTLRVVMVDLLPYEAYIPGITYDSRKTVLAKREINMDGDSFYLKTSSARDFMSLCHPFMSGFEDMIINPDLIEDFFKLVVYTAIDEKFGKGEKPRFILGCYEFILLRSDTTHTLWYKDNTNGPGLFIYPGDVIEIRGVRELDEKCGVCCDRKRDIVLKPCGMYYLCLKCYLKLERDCKQMKKQFKCPVCRAEISGYLTIKQAVQDKIDVKVSTKVSIESLLAELKA